MYRSMLFLHWKQIKHFLTLTVLVSFALPLAAVNGLGTPAGSEGAGVEPYRFVTEFQDWLFVFPLLALAIGATLALSAWNWDHRMGHVYALSLPITRWEYTLQKMLAGVTLLTVPALALWLGAHVATATITLPEGLRAYPDELAIRYFFAILVTFALFFAMAAGTIRTTAIVVGAVVGVMFFGAIANDLLADHYAFFERVRMVDAFVDWMVNGTGPFGVISGSWSLIDV